MSEPTPTRTRIASRAAPKAAAEEGPSLKDELQDLAGKRPSREQFAAEAAKLITRVSGAKAVALFVYEQRNDKLRLIGTDGIGKETLSALSGDGSKHGWDIPLRSLRNRRINVIEAAQTNPFVPKPIIAINPKQLTIASLPFYQNNLPIGVAVLFSAIHKGLSDALLVNLSQALRVCGAALSDLPSTDARDDRRGEEAPNLLRGVNTLKAELARLGRALEEAERRRADEAAERVTAESFLQGQRERVSALESELSALRIENQRLNVAREQAQQLDVQLREVVTDRESARTELTRLQQLLNTANHKVVEAEQAAKDEAAEVEALTAKRDELQEHLDEAEHQIRLRDDAAAALEAKRATLEATASALPDLEKRLSEAEETRLRLQADLAGVREELDRARTDLAQRQESITRSNEELTTFRGQAQTLKEKLTAAERSAQELKGARADLATANEMIEALENDQRAFKQELETVKLGRETDARELEATLKEWTERLTATETARARLDEELAKARTRASEAQAELNARIDATERERRQMSERLSTLSDADSDRARLAARVDELESEIQSARKSSEALEARLVQVGDVNTRLIAERRELHARVESLTRGGETIEQEKQAAINAAQQRVTELESALSRMAKMLDGSRTSSNEELMQIRAELATVSGQQETLQQNLARAQQEIELRQKEVTDLVSEREHLRATVERFERDLTEITQRLDISSTQIGQLHDSREEAVRRIAVLESERDQLTAARDTLNRQLAETREKLSAEASNQLGNAEKARHEVESALAAERQAHRIDVDGLNAQLSEVRAEMRRQIETMTRKHEAAERTWAGEAERLTRAIAERDDILQTVEERLIGGAETESGEVEVGIERDLDSMGIERSGAADESASDNEEQMEVDRQDGAPASEILLFDSADRLGNLPAQLREFGHQISTLPPEGGSVAKINGKRLACTAINLGIPSAWTALRELRSGPGSSTVPVRAYAVAPGAAAGFWFGPIDFAVLPVDDRLRDILLRLVPKIRRVIGMSTDLDVMSTVRTELNKSRISTAVVLDGRQALDMVPSVRPEAAVLHLSPTCTDVFRAIAGLRSNELAKDIPILFLMDETPHPREEAFLAAGIRMLSGRGNIKADELGEVLGESLAAFR